jgi:isopentenyl phosphate kinase
MSDLIFLKLGGSLITDKHTPHTALPVVLSRLSQEISVAFRSRPGLKLLIGHGSGSFGHIPASQYGTRMGVHTPAEWQGFAEVWREARALNQIVIEALATAGLPVIALPPSAAVLAADGQVANWDLAPLQAALAAGLLPVINGDTVFDTTRGGTILSTEELFFHLARRMLPQRILLAGIERGVWEDFPARTRLIDTITPASYAQTAHSLGASAAVDVTGGMLAKVRTMLALVNEQPGLHIEIFSGSLPGLLARALAGQKVGTCICNLDSDNL